MHQQASATYIEVLSLFEDLECGMNERFEDDIKKVNIRRYT